MRGIMDVKEVEEVEEVESQLRRGPVDEWRKMWLKRRTRSCWGIYLGSGRVPLQAFV